MNNTFHFVHIALKKKLHNMSGYKINKKKRVVQWSCVMLPALRISPTPLQTAHRSPHFATLTLHKYTPNQSLPPFPFRPRKTPHNKRKKRKKKKLKKEVHKISK